jgi:hypothetical protein
MVLRKRDELISGEGTHMTSRSMKLTAACMLAGSVAGWQAPAIAGSDNSADVWSGDYSAGSLPAGTFLAIQYAGFSRANSFVDTAGHELSNSHASILEEFTRFTYFANLLGHPLVFDAELPFATLNDVNVQGTNNLVKGGLVDPVVHFTYFAIADAHAQRWLGFTNYFHLPVGNYDNTRAFNVSTPRQFTYVPEIGYSEGLAKFSPALKGWFFDMVANASIHTDGSNPINFGVPVPLPGPVVVPGVLTYDKLTQSTSYDVKAFLRYASAPGQFVAFGIEKSWGGEQIATGGRVTVPGLGVVNLPGPQPLSKDDYLRGHLEFQFPLAQDFAVGADLFRDFTRVGGFKDDFGAEIRLTKFFFPQSPSK